MKPRVIAQEVDQGQRTGLWHIFHQLPRRYSTLPAVKNDDLEEMHGDLW